MKAAPEAGPQTPVLETGIAGLFEVLKAQGYDVVGPTVRDGAIVYEPLRSPEELPHGWTDTSAPGRYRLGHDPKAGAFGYTVAMTSWKRHLFPPEAVLLRTRAAGGTLTITGHDPVPRLALLGVRACELAAIAVQDRVFLKGPWVDPIYRERRESALLIAVECERMGPTCFCASMGTGPRLTGGYDLRLEELRCGDAVSFAIDAGSDRGRAVLDALSIREATEAERAAVAVPPAPPTEAARTLDTDGLAELLRSSLEHPVWDQVAHRCLACSNCTQVCPTCFCSTVEDVTDLAGANAERVRRWDSCFTVGHSYIHGGSIRSSIRSRYRQWLTHKLGTWHDQFGTSGCVGCGRCITWCPAAIDLTEEVRALREHPLQETVHAHP
jgi:formate hydrogenlyase subunit 6/NADH:ubiquinone oxidoreductase subunit I